MIWVVINVASMNWDVRIPQASTLIVGMGHSLGVGGWLGAWVGGWVGEWLGAENP